MQVVLKVKIDFFNLRSRNAEPEMKPHLRIEVSICPFDQLIVHCNSLNTSMEQSPSLEALSHSADQITPHLLLNT
jgi:hypothetical protein